MERIIFGCDIYVDDINEQNVYNTTMGITIGVFLWDEVATRDFDPVTTPAGDWMWCGYIPLEAILYFGTNVDSLRHSYRVPATQIEVTNRRTIGAGQPIRVVVVSTPLPIGSSGVFQWEGSAYISALWSAAG